MAEQRGIAEVMELDGDVVQSASVLDSTAVKCRALQHAVETACNLLGLTSIIENLA